MQSLGLGISDGAAGAAADDGGLLVAFQLRGLSQRADKIHQIAARFLLVQQKGALAHFLINNGHRSGLPVVIGNGQGNPFPGFVDPEDDKLSGHRLAGDKRSLDDHPGHGWIQGLFLYNFKHNSTHP